ncbi:hypothetical protein BJX96DRAFT_180232 [Aspergillus floccosus]
MLQRPETDYERWLSQQDKDFTPGDLPLYNPGVQAVDKHANPSENNDRFRGIGDRSWHNLQNKDSIHGYFIEPSSPFPVVAPMYGVLCFLVLAIILGISAALAFWKRRPREQGFSRLEFAKQPQ